MNDTHQILGNVHSKGVHGGHTSAAGVRWPVMTGWGGERVVGRGEGGGEGSEGAGNASWNPLSSWVSGLDIWSPQGKYTSSVPLFLFEDSAKPNSAQCLATTSVWL